TAAASSRMAPTPAPNPASRSTVRARNRNASCHPGVRRGPYLQDYGSLDCARDDNPTAEPLPEGVGAHCNASAVDATGVESGTQIVPCHPERSQGISPHATV